MEVILGLLVGFYARTVYDYVKRTFDLLKDKFEFDRSGVVKPQVSRHTRNQPIDLSTSTGGIRKLTPDEILMERAKERERKLKIL